MQIKLAVSRTDGFMDLPLQHEEELDDVRSIISGICEALADTSSAHFTVSGFGQECWPVNVRTDLAVFLEQLPNAIASIELGASFSIDFYEQGIERTIYFEPKGREYFARCESQTDWRPQPAIETIGALELSKMFVEIREGLMQFLCNRTRIDVG